MIVIKAFLFILIVLALPYGVGRFFESGEIRCFSDILRAYCAGFMVMVAVASLATLLIVMKFTETSLTAFSVIVTAVLLGIYVSGLILRIRKKTICPPDQWMHRLWKLWKRLVKRISCLPLPYKILYAAAVAVMAVVILVPVFTQNAYPGDDYFHLAAAGDMLALNRIWPGNPTYGIPSFSAQTNSIRHVLCGWDVLLAYFAKLTMIHPAAIARTYLAPVLIGIFCASLWNIGRTVGHEALQGSIGMVLFGVLAVWFAPTMDFLSSLYLLDTPWAGRNLVYSLVPIVMIELLLRRLPKSLSWKDTLLVTALYLASLGSSTMALFIATPAMFLIYLCYDLADRKLNAPLRKLITFLPGFVFLHILL